MIENGVDGFLYPFGQRVAMIDQLVDLWRRPALRVDLARRGKEKVLQRFTADIYIRNLEAFYGTLFRQSRTLYVRRLPK